MPANFNADDPNNPLVGLLAGRNPFGNAGQWLPFGADPGALGVYDRALYTDPRYWEQYTESGSEGGGGETRYRMRPEVAQRLGGREQLANLNIGGPAEAIDPSQVQYDSEFGLITDPDNIKDTIRTRQTMLAMLAMMAPAAVGVIGAMGAGAAGAEGAAGAVGGDPLAALAGEGFGTATGVAPGSASGVATGATGLTGGDLPYGTEAPNTYAPGANPTQFYEPLGPNPIGSAAPNFSNVASGSSTTANGLLSPASSGLTGNSMIDGLLGRAMSNPLQTAGLIQSLYGMVSNNRGSNGNSGNNGSSSKGGTGTGVPNTGSFQRGAYQPNQITAAQLQNMRFARPRGY